MDSLENFFRDRTQDHNLEFNEGDWLKLKEQLDKEMPVTFSFWTFLKKFWIIPLLLLLAPLFWFPYIQLKNHSSRDTALKSEVQFPETTRQGNLDHIYPSEKGETVKSQPLSKDLQTSESSKAHDDPLQANHSLFTNESAASDISGLRSSNDVSHSIGNASKSDLHAYDVHSNTDIISETPKHFREEPALSNKLINNKGYAVLDNGAEFFNTRKNNKLHFLSAIPPRYDRYEDYVPDFPLAESSVDLTPGTNKMASFYVGFGFSPDFSTVGSGDFVTPGSRWKVMAEYAINQYFAIHTGIVLVNNKYEALGEEYNAPPGYWRGGITAEKAFGECMMIDIPLNFRYNFLRGNKHQIFISGGVSTYFLTQEDYYFSYEQNDPDLPQHWGTDRTTVYPFGILNISLGYQHLFGRKGALQVEPFIKIPTTGIGWGEVDLQTIGAYFVYKYRIGK